MFGVLVMIPMNRQPGVIWEPPNDWQYVHLQILMDIRDELQTLNRLLRCPNFIAIPGMLKSIQRNTAKPKRKPKAR